MDEKLRSLVEAYNAACDELDSAIDKFAGLSDDADAETIELARGAVKDAEEKASAAKAAKEEREGDLKLAALKDTFKREPLPDQGKTGGIKVDEPDLYTKGNQTFLRDLFAAQVKNDPVAHERIARHQAFEVERYAVGTSTLGGIIPPQYLIDMYAKASRNGRVFADQVDHQPLPDVGMSLIVPRLTQGLAAAVQASESTAVTTQDPAETDLTVSVSTIGGYSPVSRQTLERASYSEAILFEDLIARYWAALDVDAVNGSGSGGHFLGALQTSGIKTSTVSTQTVAGAWPKFADVIQQINAATGGLGYVADKIVMHPRRWGFFEAALDGQNRPLFGINGTTYFSPAGEGDAAGYGFVGKLMGLPVYTDANLPTNLGSGTNEDWVIVMASRIVHLWERNDDPVTLAFEQQAGTSLQTQLVAYGYAAFTAGRYPAAVGVVKGMTTPSF